MTEPIGAPLMTEPVDPVGSRVSGKGHSQGRVTVREGSGKSQGPRGVRVIQEGIDGQGRVRGGGDARYSESGRQR